MRVTQKGSFLKIDDRLVASTKNIFYDICNRHNCYITFDLDNLRFEIEGEEEDVKAASKEIENFCRYNTQMIQAVNAGGCLMLPLTLMMRLFS